MINFSAKETTFKCNARKYLNKKLSVFTGEEDREWLAISAGVMPDRAPSRSAGGEVWDSGFAYHAAGVSPCFVIGTNTAEALEKLKVKKPELFNIETRMLNKKLLAQIKKSKLSLQVKEELINWNTLQKGQPKIKHAELIIKIDRDGITRLEFKDVIMYAMFDEAEKEEYVYYNSTLRQTYTEVINPVLDELLSEEIKKLCKIIKPKAGKDLYDYFSLIYIYGEKASEVLYQDLCRRESLAKTQAEFNKIKTENDLIVKRWLEIMQTGESLTTYFNGYQDKLSLAKLQHRSEMAKLLEL